MQRAPILAGLLIVFSAVATSAAAQARPGYRPVRRSIAAGVGQVQITPTTLQANSTSVDIDENRWSVRGFDLKSLIAQIYDVDVRRIDLGGSGDEDARWDVSMAIPADADEDTVEQTLKSALERKFGVTIATQTREMNVYVLSSPNGPGAGLRLHGHAGLARQVSEDSGLDDAGQITYTGRDCSGVLSSGGIEASAGTIGEFRRTLEPDLDRLLVDETNLKGSYDFKIEGYSTQDDLFRLMQEKLGIVVTPAVRNVTVLTVRPAAEMRASL